MIDEFPRRHCHRLPDARLAYYGRPVLDLNDPDAVAEWLDAHGERFTYDPVGYPVNHA